MLKRKRYCSDYYSYKKKDTKQKEKRVRFLDRKITDKHLSFQIMASVDELCQLARLGQTAKLQKFLQSSSE